MTNPPHRWRRSWLGRLSHLTSSILLGPLIVGCQPTELERNGTQEVIRAIAEGNEALDDAAIFFVEIDHPSRRTTCTASLITEDLLLTAAHCLTLQAGVLDCQETRLSDPVAPEFVRVSNVQDLQGAPQSDWIFYGVTDVRLVSPGAFLCENDLAVLRLAEPVPEEDARPLAVQTMPLVASTTYRAVGYGAVHEAGTGEGVRRSSPPQQIVCVAPDECDTDILMGAAGALAQSTPTLMPNTFLGNGRGCPGDSGGPALTITAEHSEAAIMGVLSRGSANCQSNIYMSLNSIELRELVRDLAGDAAPEWTALPEPPPGPGGANSTGGRTSDEPAESEDRTGGAGGTRDRPDAGPLDPGSDSSGSCQYSASRAHPVSSLCLLLGGVLGFALGRQRRREGTTS